MVAIPQIFHAAEQFFPGPHRCTLLGDSPGYSGSHFARVEAAGVIWCLRHWPPGFPIERLSGIHQVLIHSRAHGFKGVPHLARVTSGETVVEFDGALFDAQEWLHGIPLDWSPGEQQRLPNRVQVIPPTQLTALAAALAAFHRSTDGCGVGESVPRRPLLQQLAESHANIAIEALTIPDSPDRRIAARWAAILPVLIARAAVLLQSEEEAARNAGTLCHGDLWASHLFFSGTAFSGFIDFESLSRTTPTHDLAQLILHCADWSAHDLVVHAYEQVRPLDRATRAVLRAAALLDLASEGGWSLAALCGNEREHLDEHQRARHLGNLRALLISADALLADS